MSSHKYSSVRIRFLLLLALTLGWTLDSLALQGGTEPPWSAHRRPPPARSTQHTSGTSNP